MKLSAKELREIAANPNDEGAPVCAELLTLRREVRRLREALRLASSLLRDPMADRFPRAYMLDVRAVVAAALKPKRGAK